MKLMLVWLLLLSPLVANAWNGYDYENGTYIEIDKGNLVRAGEEIEIYDHSSGEYRSVEVQSITGSGAGAEIEVYDSTTGEYRTLDMD